ncbi:Acetylxylan esterase 2 [Colletotrichum orbiculare MAFF 240422]|uniref:Acetylxylan esterase 2 n=1 Tax=Colletotrichum orbiculare (strain 104-T / ATCC 96160 / CBS 514.97 / LARS 414 / MAFF 240422) TaxID=1213857 RepID=A0A484FFA3_COLOR|nr:Acetylxylan esterase 2 [Colletotrichum orbiculare MAFF 240422]
MVPSPAVIVLAFLGAVQPGASALVPRQAAGCATGVHMIVARASTERPGPGIIGGVANRVQSQIPGSDMVSVDYPAQLNPYQPSQRAGVTAMTKLVQDYATQCPQSKMVLMGYSQGAHVTADVLCGTSEPNFPATQPVAADIADKIAAVVLMGDPSHVPSQPFNKGTAKNNGVFPRGDSAACGALASRMASFCDSGDTFCDSGNSLQVHMGYVRRSGDAAASFIVGMVQGGGATRNCFNNVL